MSDYHEKNISQPIEITLEIDISDENDDDNEFIRAKVKEAADRKSVV